MSNFLFIHQNFPGQFRHLAPALVQAGHAVCATTLQQNSPRRWQGIDIYPYVVKHRPVKVQHPWLADLETKTLRGEACLHTLLAMRETGYRPDVVFAHLGWGEALFVKDVWPETQLAIYGEFFYRTHGADVGFDSEFGSVDTNILCKLRLRNANQLLHLEAADAVLAPTHWQAETFPKCYREHITVIHDGIDTHSLIADPTTLRLKDNVLVHSGDEIITFVSRNLEPYRGYHIFMRALPHLLRKRPQARVLIVGGDKVSYGAAAPDKKSWKKIFIDEVYPQISSTDWQRVFFLGHLPYDKYLAVMRVSAVHVYLTYPFVLSWSLLEAMSLGCAIVGSDTPPLREVIVHGKNGRLIDFFDFTELVQQVCDLLDDATERRRLGQAARAYVVQHYDLPTICLPRQIAWLEMLASTQSSYIT